MGKKSAKVAALVERCQGQDLDARYLGYFECFNAELFYESHDVLEDLWLPERGGLNDLFYKGLIQLAGAFVHLQKGRLKPAGSLFRLARSNLERYPDGHEQLAVGQVLSLIEQWLGCLERSGFQENPLQQRPAPKLKLERQL